MAAPGFGFSAGDFISGISLVKKLIRALNDAAGSRASYRQLISELLNLDEALGQVKDLHASPGQAAQKDALQQIAGKCQLSIGTFLNKNSKFKESLGLQPSASAWKSNLHKIQWALCKDGAIEELRKEIAAHTTTLNLTLATNQLSATQFQGETLEGCKQILQSVEDGAQESNALAKLNHQLLTTHTDLIMSLSSTLASLSTGNQINELQCLVQKVQESHSITFNAVMQIQQLQSNIPPQVEFQQPVVFEDAHQRRFPFHIEFIDSFSAFQQLLESKFEKVPGLRKVKRLEYVMRDMASKRAVDLSRPWESVVRPGRRVLMSMVFQRPNTSTSSCPGCLAESPDSPDSGDSDLLCSNRDCGMWYRRVTEIDTVRRGKRKLEESRHGPAKRRKTGQGSARNRGGSAESDVDEDKEDEVQEFRRVQIVHKEARTSTASTPTTSTSTIRRGSPGNAIRVVNLPISTSGEDHRTSCSRHSASGAMQIDTTTSFPGPRAPEPQSQFQGGLTPSSNMSVDTDCDRICPPRARESNAMWTLGAASRWEGSARRPIGNRRSTPLGGVNSIFARVGTPSTTSHETPKLRRQDTLSKSFYGWVLKVVQLFLAAPQ